MADWPQQRVSDDPELPPTLAAALRGLYDVRVEVPAVLDNAVLGDARKGFGRRRRFRTALRWVGAAAAAAAAVVVVAVNLHQHRAPTNIAVAPVAGDVDGNGRVDMLDAFVLAKRVDAGSAAGAKFEDVNGDGVIDRRDVDAVAAIAVRLPGGVQ